MGNYVFREAAAADLVEIKRVGLSSFGAYRSEMEKAEADRLAMNMMSDKTWEPLLRNAFGVVCEHEGVLVGIGFLVPSGNPWDVFPADVSYLRMVGVDPSMQGKGIAKEITRRCIEHAKVTGESVIALHTSEMMQAAMHIYASFGFIRTRPIPDRLGKKYWMYELRLEKS